MGPRPVKTLALEWAETEKPAARKLPHHPRQARPDAVNLLPDVRATTQHGTQGKRRDGAPEGAPAPLWPVISGPDLPEMGPIARRATGAPGLRAPASPCAPSPLGFSRGRCKGKRRQPARHDKRAGQR